MCAECYERLWVDQQRYHLVNRAAPIYGGLYFIGMPWLVKFKSGLLIGVGEDAEYIAAHIAAQRIAS